MSIQLVEQGRGDQLALWPGELRRWPGLQTEFLEALPPFSLALGPWKGDIARIQELSFEGEP